jgi:ribosomal-protein-alanine N-acetyltransferase
MMATVEHDVLIGDGSSGDINSVMIVMEGSFGRRFGEAWTRSQLAGILPMAGVSLVLAREPRTGEIIGFSLSRTVADEAELLLLAVSPAHQRRGIGRCLLEEFLDRARKAGVARVHLEVRDGNPAVAMYRTVGFLPVGRRCNYYHSPDGSRFDAITLAYQL